MRTSSSDRLLPRIDWRASIRLFRCHHLEGITIHAHHGERIAEIRHPLGFGWRRYAGLRWCPVCGSVHPLDWMRKIKDREVWCPAETNAEMAALVARGEMEPSQENFLRSISPLDDQVHAFYVWSSSGEIRSLTFDTADYGRVDLAIAHLADLSLADRALAIAEMNRWAPALHLASGLDGYIKISQTGIAIVSMSTSDEDDDDAPDGEPGC